METEPPCWHMIGIALACAVSVSLVFFFFKSKGPKPKVPPGPKPWPILGNLNLIGHLPHQSLHFLSQKYGPIMHLMFGSSDIVVASSSHFVKHFLKTYDHVFVSRPQTAAGKHTTYNYSNITWAPYGPYCRQGRKIYLMELFSPKRLESFHYIRLEEEGVVKLEEFQEMLDELFLLNGVLNLGDWMPWLDWMDLQGYMKRMKNIKKRFDRFHEHVIQEHKARKKEEGTKFVPKDMMDLLLDLVEDPSLDVNFTYDGVRGFTQDLIAGGTDTSATTIDWAMSELIKQPHLIKKAIEELDTIIGRERWVEESDIPELPYLDAIIKETMRLHPVAVLLAPHLALQDCKVEGYDIKKGTTVFINTWSIGRDPSMWDSPEEFIPERFLGKAIDVKGQSFELLPFGSGRRMCPGYSLGLKMISSGLANLLHGFNWRLPKDMKPQDLNMEEVYGLATVRKFPLVLEAEPRLPLHLYSVH